MKYWEKQIMNSLDNMDQLNKPTLARICLEAGFITGDSQLLKISNNLQPIKPIKEAIIYTDEFISIKKSTDRFCWETWRLQGVLDTTYHFDTFPTYGQHEHSPQGHQLVIGANKMTDFNPTIMYDFSTEKMKLWLNGNLSGQIECLPERPYRFIYEIKINEMDLSVF